MNKKDVHVLHKLDSIWKYLVNTGLQSISLINKYKIIKPM